MATATTAQEESPTATVVVTDWIRYTEDALSVFEENYLWSARIDWGPIRETAVSAVRMSPTEGGAHQALDAALSSLNDRHTRFVYPPGTGLPEPEPVLQPVVGRNLEGDIGYLFVPAVVGDGPTLSRYASDLHEAMREIATVSTVCGWVVDLRLNTGGYLPAMILGLGPLLGDGVVVTYRGTQERSSSGSESIWSATYEYRPPHVYLEGEVASDRWGTLETEPFVPTDPTLPVALLISDLTTSAGEGVLVAFLGRPAMRTFGTASAGLTTGPVRFPLPDGAALVIATSVAEDRIGRIYETEIGPHERIVDLVPDDENDVVLEAASAWLSVQEPCEGS